ncbi:MAG: hypothetical protein ACTSU5_01305 [Promethearchaeota archaeon]
MKKRDEFVVFVEDGHGGYSVVRQALDIRSDPDGGGWVLSEGGRRALNFDPESVTQGDVFLATYSALSGSYTPLPPVIAKADPAFDPEARELAKTQILALRQGQAEMESLIRDVERIIRGKGKAKDLPGVVARLRELYSRRFSLSPDGYSAGEVPREERVNLTTLAEHDHPLTIGVEVVGPKSRVKRTAILDTGATVSLIDIRVAVRAGLEPDSRVKILGINTAGQGGGHLFPFARGVLYDVDGMGQVVSDTAVVDSLAPRTGGYDILLHRKFANALLSKRGGEVP